jgi:hypothetical protein
MTMKHYSNDELFRFNEKLTPVVKDGVVYIDNLYENADDIHDWLTSQQYPLWKYNEERPTSRNGKDYLDCRLIHKIGYPTRLYQNQMAMLMNICRDQGWWNYGYSYDEAYEFNCFQSLENHDSAIQHYPHIDSALNALDSESVINVITYLDKQENGGTAVYEGTWISNDEQENLLYPVEELFDIKQIIPHKFNRLVMFPGNQLHGAYIEDYSKYMGENWRYTQVTFFHPQRK